MAIKSIDLRRGMAVSFKDGIWVCVDNQKVAKGNWRSYQVIQLKNIRTGQLIEDRFRTDEQFEEAFVERKPLEYMYSLPDAHVAMDMQTYEEVHLPSELIGDKSVYLQPNMQIMVSLIEGKPVIAEMPNTVELVVTEAPPEVKSATVTNVMKEVVCEGGAKVKVPQFINIGTTIKVDTRTGEYLGKA